MNQPTGSSTHNQHLVPSAHAETSAAPRRTASSGSRASCPQTAATPSTPSGPTSASCTTVCSQSAWWSSASATARAMSLTAATVPTRASASAVCRVTALSSTSSNSRTNASAASGTSAKEARSRPARTRCDHEGDNASAKAASNPLIISDTTRQSHAPRRRSNPGPTLPTRLTKDIEAPPAFEAFHGLKPDPLPRDPPSVGQPAALRVSHDPELPELSGHCQSNAPTSPHQVQMPTHGYGTPRNPGVRAVRNSNALMSQDMQNSGTHWFRAIHAKFCATGSTDMNQGPLSPGPRGLPGVADPPDNQRGGVRRAVPRHEPGEERVVQLGPHAGLGPLGQAPPRIRHLTLVLPPPRHLPPRRPGAGGDEGLREVCFRDNGRRARAGRLENPPSRAPASRTLRKPTRGGAAR